MSPSCPSPRRKDIAEDCPSARTSLLSRCAIALIAPLVLVVAVENSIAQTAQDPTIITPNTVTGIQPYGTYDGVNENINLSNV